MAEADTQRGQEAPPDYETVFTNAKAGMEDVDREHVKRVVYEMSKDSAHFKNEQRKTAQVDERIAKMKEQAKRLSPAELAAHTRAMDLKIAELEAGRDLTRTWLHVDMDAFFAAVEELDNPQLKGKPFAVGGIGMISTASYPARKFGVRSAMPGFIGLKLCPQLIFVRPNFDKYTAASHATREIFRQYDPAFEAGSLDEAYLDVTDYCREHGATGGLVGEEIRRRVREETRLTCSVGVACNRMLAKVCSDLHKPDGQYVLEASRERVAAFIRTLPIRKVPGVGKVTERMLNAFGVSTCQGLVEKRGLLAALFTALSVDFFLAVGLGLGGTEHGEGPREGEVGRKGISCEQTFRNMSARDQLEAKCRELAASLAADMAAEGLKGKTLGLKLKLSTFELRTRALTLDRYISSADDIAAAALRLLRAELPVEIRLMGLRMSNFFESKREAGQLSLEEMLQRGGAKGQGQQGQGQQQGHGEREQGEAGSPAHGSSPVSGSGALQQQQQQQQQQQEQALGALRGGSQGQRLSQGELVELSLRDWQDAATAQQQQQQQEQQQQEGGSSRSPGDAGAGASHEGTQSSLSWSCSACTFENTRLFARCEVCGTARRRAPQQQQQQQAGGGKGREGAKGGGGGAGAKRKGAPMAGSGAGQGVAASSRILMGFLTHTQPANEQQQHAQLAQQQQASPVSVEELNSPPSGSAAAGSGGRSRLSSPSAAQQAASSPQIGDEGGLAQAVPSGSSSPAPGGPQSPRSGSGEFEECQLCRQWVPLREYQQHQDWHLAKELQQQEGGLNRASGTQQQQQQAAGGKRGVPGGQATLTALLKRPKS